MADKSEKKLKKTETNREVPEDNATMQEADNPLQKPETLPGTPPKQAGGGSKGKSFKGIIKWLVILLVIAAVLYLVNMFVFPLWG